MNNREGRLTLLKMGSRENLLRHKEFLEKCKADLDRNKQRTLEEFNKAYNLYDESLELVQIALEGKE